jgi:hypothetical protein
MNNFKKMIISLISIILLSGSLSHGQSELVMDLSFFKKFSSISAISRDVYLEGYLNSIIIARGKIISITPSDRYKKKYKITIESKEAVKFGQRFIFYVFLENENAAELLMPETDFEFKGQFMGYTPANSKRTWYIIDLILMDASSIIK